MFGRARIPSASQVITLPQDPRRREPFPPSLSGRVIRVPVVNARGAGEAQQVHARLLFLPDDVHRTLAPRDPAQGEWFSEQGPEIEIDIPGNDRPRYIDVALVLDGPYPYVYEWTDRSRAANLEGYGVKAVPVDVEITVTGSGLGGTAPRLTRTLRIECRSSQIRADWLDAGSDEVTNYVPWSAERI
jgi:hypothetical protein